MWELACQRRRPHSQPITVRSTQIKTVGASLLAKVSSQAVMFKTLPNHPNFPTRLSGCRSDALPITFGLSLLMHACATLASLNVMASNQAVALESAQRSSALAIQQRVSLMELTELAVNRALDNVDQA